MTIYSTTRLIPTHFIRHLHRDFRIRMLQILAIDSEVHAQGELSHLEQAAQQESRLMREAARHRAQGMSQPRHFSR